MVTALCSGIGDYLELLWHRLVNRDPQVYLPPFPIHASLFLFLRALGCPFLPDVEHLLHARTDLSLFAVRSALAGKQLWLWFAGYLSLCQRVRMHACFLPCVL